MLIRKKIMLKNHVYDFFKNWLNKIFLNRSESSLYYKKLFFKIKNGGHRTHFQAILA